jgi:hypothetical protein
MHIGMNGRCLSGHMFQLENSWTDFAETFKGIFLLEATPNSYFVISYT